MRHDPQKRLFGKIIAHAANSKQIRDLTWQDFEKMSDDYFNHLSVLHDQAYAHLANNKVNEAAALAKTLYDVLPRSPEANILRAKVLKTQGDLDGFHSLLQWASSLLGEQEAQELPYSFGDPKQATEEMRLWWVNSNPSMRHRRELQEVVLSWQLQSAYEQFAKTNNVEEKSSLKRKMLDLCGQLIQKNPYNPEYKKTKKTIEENDFGKTMSANINLPPQPADSNKSSRNI